MQVFSPLSIKLNILNNIEGSGVVTYFVHLKERKKGSSMALGSTNNYIIKKTPNQTNKGQAITNSESQFQVMPIYKVSIYKTLKVP